MPGHSRGNATWGYTNLYCSCSQILKALCNLDLLLSIENIAKSILPFYIIGELKSERNLSS